MTFDVFTHEALDQSSNIARYYYGKVKGSVKKDDNNQVLTKADLEIGRYLISSIKKKFPKHNIIDEEVGVIHGLLIR